MTEGIKEQLGIALDQGVNHHEPGLLGVLRCRSQPAITWKPVELDRKHPYQDETKPENRDRHTQ